MTFHFLLCDACGAGRHVSFYDDLTEYDGKWPQNPGEDPRYDEYVELIAGHCACGGQFTFDALIRCPRCRSTDVDWDKDNPSVLID